MIQLIRVSKKQEHALAAIIFIRKWCHITELRLQNSTSWLTLLSLQIMTVHIVHAMHKMLMPRQFDILSRPCLKVCLCGLRCCGHFARTASIMVWWLFIPTRSACQTLYPFHLSQSRDRSAQSVASSIWAGKSFSLGEIFCFPLLVLCTQTGDKRLNSIEKYVTFWLNHLCHLRSYKVANFIQSL